MNIKSRTTKVVSSFVGFAMALSFVVTPVIASAATAAELQAQINSLLATINSLQSQLGSTGGSVSTGFTFNTNLTVGSKGTDVMNLQKVLNMSSDTMIASTGAGSPGMETSTFGQLTKNAVIKFQKKNGISPAAGYVGPMTRAKLNSMSTGTTGGTTTGGTTGGTTTGAGTLMVSAASQPMNSLAPTSASRVPFTNVTLTAGASDVVVNSITVERGGLAQDAVFSGVILLDSNGMQIGISKTLNSNHQAVIGEPFTVKAGTSMTVTVAGNMASSLTSYAGQVAALNVVAVNTSATVAGSLPIMGAMHTINASLSLGSVTVNTSSFDPNSGLSQPIGTTGFRMSALRLTAGSAEDLTLKSIRWNQTGSASSQDLANVVTVINGTSYPTTVSADGKYYTTVIPGGIVIAKGNSVDVYVQADIVGSSAANRTVEFDIYKNTDVYLTGNTYGYGVTAPTGSGSVSTTANHGTTINTSSNPWFQGSQHTITAGSVTTIGKANEVAAQNIAVNVTNQPLGGFATNFTGEPISVQSMVFTVSSSSGSAGGPLTNVTIVDENGAVVAGPIDETSVASGGNGLTFTDTITFPTGRHVYTIKGKVASNTTNGATITLGTTPSSQWTNVTGQTTGSTVSLSGAGIFSMNTMTVKGATLSVAISSQPAAQNVVGGTQNFVLAKYQLDASQSGEDIRLSAFPVTITATSTDLTGCQLWDGTTALNTGSRVVNSFTSGTKSTYTFDNSMTVPKGTIKTLSLACNVASSPASTYYVVNADTTASDYTITGATSGNSVTTSSGLTLASNNGNTMTVGNGSLAVSVDSSSPSYTVVAGGTTGQTVAVIKLRASNEAVNLNKIGLILTSGSTTDVVSASIYQGATLIGTATWTGNSLTATSTLNSPLSLTKDTDVLLTVKADFANVGTSQSGTQGKLVKIDPVNVEGTGASSGSTLRANATANVAGVRLFKSYPTLALDSSLGSTGIADGRLIRFKVTATSNGSVGIQQFNFKVASTSATVTNVGLYAYTDASYSSPISGQSSGGQIGSSVQSTIPNNVAFSITPQTNPVQVPAGSTVYFELRGSVSGVVSGSSVVTTLLGDSSYPSSYVDTTRGYQVATSSAITGSQNFVWSGNATSTSATGDVDWSNGYGLPGLPASGLIQTRSN